MQADCERVKLSSLWVHTQKQVSLSDPGDNAVITTGLTPGLPHGVTLPPGVSQDDPDPEFDSPHSVTLGEVSSKEDVDTTIPPVTEPSTSVPQCHKPSSNMGNAILFTRSNSLVSYDLGTQITYVCPEGFYNVPGTATIMRCINPPHWTVIQDDILCEGKHGCHGPLTRYVTLRVAHAPGMPGTFSPSPRISDPDMHHGTCVMHVPWCMPGSLTNGFLGSRWREKRSQHSWCMRNPQFGVSGKSPMVHLNIVYSRNLAVKALKVALKDTLIARLMGPIWGPSGADRTQVGPMLAPWTLLSGHPSLVSSIPVEHHIMEWIPLQIQTFSFKKINTLTFSVCVTLFLCVWGWWTHEFVISAFFDESSGTMPAVDPRLGGKDGLYLNLNSKNTPK